MENVIIIGSGPAGMTAAIYTARAELKPLVAAGIQWGGLLMWTTEVENFPGYPEAILGPELMGNMKKQAEKFGARFILDNVTEIDIEKQPFRIKIGNEWHETKTLIIAAGTKPRTLKLPREKEFIGRGLSVCATCDGAFFKGKDVAVIGGGDSAMEEADFLTKFVNHVTILVRGDKLRASEIMAERAKENPKITIKYNEEVKEYIGDQFITGIKVANNQTNEEYELPISGLFFAIGQQPETGLFANKLPTDSEGYLSKGCNNTMTNVEGIFIAGDISDKIYRQAIVAAGEGAKAAIDVARYMHEKKM